MKMIKISSIAAIAILFHSCGNNGESSNEIKQPKVENHEGHNHGTSGHDGHEHETYFTCEHHPEVHEHSPGKCPKCQMDLISSGGEAHEHEGHSHEIYYSCPNHPGVHEHAPGNCSICNSELTKKEGEGH
jgi:Cu(I)/Ag(I) efflux system membrane fusion protein